MSVQTVSKLEIYVTILEALEKNGSLTIQDLERKAGFSRSILTLALNFLEQQDYVKSIGQQEHSTYENTAKGKNISRFFGKSPQITEKCFP